MKFNVTGSQNVSIGYAALYRNTSGNNNTAIGTCSLAFNNVGVNNIGIGYKALQVNCTGSNNIGLGSCAGCSINTGACNVVIGANNGINIATSANNIILADGAGNIRQLWNANGALSVNGSSTFGTAGQVLTSQGVGSAVTWSSASGSLPLVLNDISNQFDNLKAVFDLRLDQANVSNTSIVHSGNIEVVVNGLKLSPYIKQNTYPWLATYDSYKGYRVVSTNTQSSLIIYNAPAPGDQATVTIINNSLALQTRKYPYSAATIALGD
jgi:hypothetical protein